MCLTSVGHFGITRASTAKHDKCLWLRETEHSILQGNWGETQDTISSPVYDKIFPFVILDLLCVQCHVGYGTYMKTFNIFATCESIR